MARRLTSAFELIALAALVLAAAGCSSGAAEPPPDPKQATEAPASEPVGPYDPR
ncbi:MAG: hypothetical protein ACK41F_14465 [Fimbriimonadaceae bacterium]